VTLVMFGLDVEKLAVFGIIALIVIGPKELPTVMRSVGRIVRKVTSFRDEIHRHLQDLTREVDAGSDTLGLRQIDRRGALDFNNNSAIPEKGELPRRNDDMAPEAVAEAFAYASPEMRAYLAPEDAPATDRHESAE
jgi:sec-independent protein translocase protein TatB